MTRRRLVFENGTTLSTPIRRTGSGPVSLEMNVLILQGGILDVTLLESSEGFDWSIVADWQSNAAYWGFVRVACGPHWRRAHIEMKKVRGTLLEPLLLEFA